MDCNGISNKILKSAGEDFINSLVIMFNEINIFILWSLYIRYHAGVSIFFVSLMHDFMGVPLAIMSGGTSSHLLRGDKL